MYLIVDYHTLTHSSLDKSRHSCEWIETWKEVSYIHSRICSNFQLNIGKSNLELDNYTPDIYRLNYEILNLRLFEYW